MADQNVPPRWWDGPAQEHPAQEHPGPYGDRESRDGGGWRESRDGGAGQRTRPGTDPRAYRSHGPGPQPGYQPAGAGARVYPGGLGGQPVAPGPGWGPEGITGAGDRQATTMLPDTAEEDDGRGVARRRALAAFGGTAAVVVGGAALAISPMGRDLTGRLFGSPPDAEAAVPTDGTAARPSGQQPSTVRTYTEQNESYMGSRAGAALKKNTPTTGQVFDGPAEAAARTQVTVRTVLAKDPVRHLASRATFGATPKLISEIKRLGMDEWLRRQLDPEKIAPTRAELKLSELTTLRMSPVQLRDGRESLNAKGVRADKEYIDATIARQIWSDRQLFEVMVDFWNDFLHVGPEFDNSDVVRGAFDRDVIRKHALGSYADMLVAANRHPALLIYLNQIQSHKNEVNENLARENLELYSVGVDGGYKEADVRQAALLQTGRTIDGDFAYTFEPTLHYVGRVKILGYSAPNTSAEGGDKAGEAYFRYLANHSSTARYVAQSLATRFVSDTPPKSLVDRLAKTYTANRTAIKPVLMTLFSSSEFWASVGQKVRRPMEYLVATYRTLGVSPDPSPGYRAGEGRGAFANGLSQIRSKMAELGQFPTGMPTPNGYPDVFVAWTSAGTMINGWNEAATLIGGGHPEFSYVKPEALVGAKAPTTAGAYVDALARRLIHQPLTTRQRSLILGIAGVASTAKVDAAFLAAVPAMARALLASPQHHLR